MKIVTEDYSIAYSDPLTLKPKDQVTVIKAESNPEWIGWHFCKDQNGKEGWISEDYMTINIEKKIGTITKSYTAKELDAKVNEEVEVTSESRGWAWCKKSDDEGWLPKNILRDKA